MSDVKSPDLPPELPHHDIDAEPKDAVADLTVVYDYEAQGDRIYPSDATWQRKQRVVLLGSCTLAMASCVNGLATWHTGKAIENPIIDTAMNVGTATNILVFTGALFATSYSAISIRRVKSQAESSKIAHNDV